MKYNFLLHLHPQKIKSDAIKFNITFGLGGMAALLFVIQLITGLLLKFHYIPNPVGAYESILNIENNLFFGQLLRNLHHWSAILLIWITFLHLLRIVFTGAFYPPRHGSWYLGIGLIILVIISNFTGYLLVWDQLSYWAITISTSLIGYIPLFGYQLKEFLLAGNTINEQTLSNFYNLHTGFMPVVMLLLMSWHFWKIRKAGGVILSEKAKNSQSIDVNPHLIVREMVVALALLAFLLILSALFDANLQEKANPYDSPNPTKAPWYFMGFQEMLIHFHPSMVINVFPAFILTFFIWMPFSKFDENKSGVWFSSINGKKVVILFSILSLLVCLLIVITEQLIIDANDSLTNTPVWIGNGVLLFLILVLLFGSLIFTAFKRFNLSALEGIQVIIASLSVVYIVFSITGIFFRGQGMQLMWPWQF